MIGGIRIAWGELFYGTGRYIRWRGQCAPPARRRHRHGSRQRAVLLDPDDGFFRTCEIDLDGLACVLDLRSRYGEPKTTLSDPLKYCDFTYFERAVGGS